MGRHNLRCRGAHGVLNPLDLLRPTLTLALISALAHLNRQSIYLAEVSTTGQMTKAWRFQGSALQIGTVSISNTNGVYAGGVRAMLNKQHLAVLAHYRQQFTLPDGTQWSAALHTDNSSRLNTADKTPFLMKLDVSSTNGVGTGTTGWARVMDEDHLGVTIHPGGVSIHSVDGDTNGDMIVSYTGYSGYNASTEEMTGGVSYVTKLLAADGSEVWKKVVPKKLANCRAINDGSFFCGYSMSSSDTAVDFGNGKIVSAAAADMGSRDKKAVVVKFDGLGVAQWAKDSSSHNVGFSRMAASVDGTVLVLTAGGVTSRMDTTPGSEGAIVWTDRNPGAGGHSGFRGLEVTGDGGEVVVHGSVSGSAVTLVDSANSEIELRTRGSYEVFVAAFDGTTGKGKWAIDGGGTGMEYMFSMAVDPDTRDVYVGGTSRCDRAPCIRTHHTHHRSHQRATRDQVRVHYVGRCEAQERDGEWLLRRLVGQPGIEPGRLQQGLHRPDQVDDLAALLPHYLLRQCRPGGAGLRCQGRPLLHRPPLLRRRRLFAVRRPPMHEVRPRHKCYGPDGVERARHDLPLLHRRQVRCEGRAHASVHWLGMVQALHGRPVQ